MDRNIFEDYNFQNLRSALITHAQERIERSVREVGELKNTQFWFTTIIVTIIAAFVTVALSLSTSLKELDSPELWLVAIVLGSIFTFIVSILLIAFMRFKNLFSIVGCKLQGRDMNALKYEMARQYRISFLVLPLLLFFAAVGGYFVASNLDHPQEVETIRDSISTLEAELSEIKRQLNTNVAH